MWLRFRQEASVFRDCDMRGPRRVSHDKGVVLTPMDSLLLTLLRVLFLCSLFAPFELPRKEQAPRRFGIDFDGAESVRF